MTKLLYVWQVICTKFGDQKRVSDKYDCNIDFQTFDKLYIPQSAVACRLKDSVAVAVVSNVVVFLSQFNY